MHGELIEKAIESIRERGYHCAICGQCLGQFQYEAEGEDYVKVVGACSCPERNTWLFVVDL